MAVAEPPAPALTTPVSAAAAARTGPVVGLLLVVYTLNYLDRQIANIVAEPIKAELGLADWQLGLMTGLAFAVFYSVLGVPLARYADQARTNRPALISLCLAVWSAMTALCGLAQNFTQLLLARIGVGVGEAGCSPAAHSLISDIVPREQRASAMATYSLGIPLGKLFGLLIGGLVAHALGWRMAFLILGIPGVLLAFFTWRALPEPRRERRLAATAPGVSMLAAIRLLGPSRTFWTITLAGAFMSFLSYGQTAFLGSFYIRVHGVDVGQAGVMLGLALGGAGAVGTWLGGRITDQAAKRDGRALVGVPLVASGIGAVLFVAAVLAPGMWTSLALLALATAFTSAWYGPVFATVQSLVEPELRATAAAVHLFFISLIGLGTGPLLFGVVSDLLNAGVPALSIAPLGPAQGLRYALLTGAVGTVVALGFFTAAMRTVRAEVKPH